ncbi:MAG: phosphoribosylamine--glycine ligase [Bacteroidetes bacterium]|nr:phosphoribosylamine--glycine ligase [Bacteroidota bacterium]
MNVLLLGSGGREHAFAMKMAESSRLGQLYIAPGNAGTANFGINVNVNPTDLAAVYDFCKAHQISLVVPGNEDPLVAGITDYIEAAAATDGLKIAVAGPSAWCAQLEGSKDFSKAFMGRHNIPTARYQSFQLSQLDEAAAFLKTLEPPFVLKADGLAAGKGVIITPSFDEAMETLQAMTDGSKFGKAGEVVVIEEFLKGIELSVFGISDGKDWKILASAKDYKRIFDNDEGPNTGGMGAISPVPFADETFMQKVVDRIMKPTYAGLVAEGHPYKGFLFVGLMNVDGEPFVIEYNVRMGDPETEAIFPRLQTPMLDLLEAMATNSLSSVDVRLDDRTAATIFLVSGGYPGDIEKGKEIQLPALRGVDQWLFHAGTKQDGNRVVTNGGRVIAVTSLGDDIAAALQRSNELASQIHFEGKFNRTDIGLDLMRLS